MAGRMSVKEAAALTGLSELTIRLGIKSGSLEFGRAIPSKSKKRYSYHISPNKLYEYLEIEGKKKDTTNITSADAKIMSLEKEIASLKKEIDELQTIISSLISNQEYLIKRINGAKVDKFSLPYVSVMEQFQKKISYESANNDDKVTVKRAAELLGVSPMWIRLGMISGELPFGSVTQRKTYNGNYINKYHIYAKKLAEYLGISVDEVLKK